MPLHAPSPRAAGPRRPKNAERVIARITLRASPLLHLFKYLVEAHDRLGLHIAALRQPAGKERVSERLLCGVHVVPGDSFALARNEMPVVALLVVEGEAG